MLSTPLFRFSLPTKIPKDMFDLALEFSSYILFSPLPTTLQWLALKLRPDGAQGTGQDEDLSVGGGRGGGKVGRSGIRNFLPPKKLAAPVGGENIPWADRCVAQGRRHPSSYMNWFGSFPPPGISSSFSRVRIFLPPHVSHVRRLLCNWNLEFLTARATSSLPS